MNYLRNFCFNLKKKRRAHSGIIVTVRDRNKQTNFKVILTSLWAHTSPLGLGSAEAGSGGHCPEISGRGHPRTSKTLSPFQVINLWRMDIWAILLCNQPPKKLETEVMGMDSLWVWTWLPTFILARISDPFLTSLLLKLMTKSKMAKLECLCPCESRGLPRG